MDSAATNGVKVEYETRGVGKPVALVHLSLCADSFATLMDQPALAGYQLIRYHRRGYAGSSQPAGAVAIADQAADLAGLLDSLRLRRAHVVGHSYGGLMALQLALDRPDLVDSLALMESALRVRSGGPASQDLSKYMAAAMQSYRQGDRAGAVDRWLTAVFAPGYRQLLDHLFPGSWEQAVQDADMFFGIEVPELQRWQFGTAEAARIDVPVLSMVGSESDAAFFEMEELLKGLLPQLETVRMPGLNHLLCMREPRPVAESLAQFFARHSPTQI
jgi:pimeloyl-ACP methyl ester carboxylesterase